MHKSPEESKLTDRNLNDNFFLFFNFRMDFEYQNCTYILNRLNCMQRWKKKYSMIKFEMRVESWLADALDTIFAYSRFVFLFTSMLSCLFICFYFSLFVFVSMSLWKLIHTISPLNCSLSIKIDLYFLFSVIILSINSTLE